MRSGTRAWAAARTGAECTARGVVSPLAGAADSSPLDGRADPSLHQSPVAGPRNHCFSAAAPPLLRRRCTASSARPCRRCWTTRARRSTGKTTTHSACCRLLRACRRLPIARLRLHHRHPPRAPLARPSTTRPPPSSPASPRPSPQLPGLPRRVRHAAGVPRVARHLAHRGARHCGWQRVAAARRGPLLVGCAASSAHPRLLHLVLLRVRVPAGRPDQDGHGGRRDQDPAAAQAVARAVQAHDPPVARACATRASPCRSLAAQGPARAPRRASPPPPSVAAVTHTSHLAARLPLPRQHGGARGHQGGAAAVQGAHLAGRPPCGHGEHQRGERVLPVRDAAHGHGHHGGGHCGRRQVSARRKR